MPSGEATPTGIDPGTRSGLPVLTRPIFVGGVSRSGTTVMGKHLLGRHDEIACTIPAEMWFLTNTGGLCDMTDGARSRTSGLRMRANAARRGTRSPLDAFERRMTGFWYRREWWKDGRPKGLCQSVDEEQLADALASYRSGYRADPIRAARVLAADLIDPSVRSRGKSRWVDTTPGNTRRVASLHQIFPDLRLINMVRDGRDVAASIVGRDWGTDDIDRALRSWHQGMKSGHAAMSRVPAAQVMTVRLESLLGPDRERVYEDLLAFLGVGDSADMRTFFTTRMTADAAHVGRWRADLDPAQRARIDRAYERMVADLGRRGVIVPG